MEIDILTLFPAMFRGPFEESIIKRAVEQDYLSLRIHNFRDFAPGKHHHVDDYSYGGGEGMVLKCEPVFNAVEALKQPDQKLIFLTPQGRRFNHELAKELAAEPKLMLFCGHYEGFDERIREKLADDEISIGDYVLTGGELAAMVIVDAVSRFLPGVLGNETAAHEDSFSNGLLEYPHYTRPAEFRGMNVPEVLRNGNHKEIIRWREEQSLLRTRQRRPDLIKNGDDS